MSSPEAIYIAKLCSQLSSDQLHAILKEIDGDFELVKISNNIAAHEKMNQLIQERNASSIYSKVSEICKANNWSAFISGGSVLYAMGASPDYTDIDIYMSVDDVNLAKKIIMDTIPEAFSKSKYDYDMLGFIVYCVGKVDIIITKNSIKKILGSFDLNCCKVAWSKTDFLLTPSALSALLSKSCPAPLNYSGASIFRAKKYIQRGFKIEFPDGYLE